MKKRIISLMLAAAICLSCVVMASAYTLPNGMQYDIKITYKISDELYAAGARFSSTDEQTKLYVKTTGSTTYVSAWNLYYNGAPIEDVTWSFIEEINALRKVSGGSLSYTIMPGDTLESIGGGVQVYPGEELTLVATAPLPLEEPTEEVTAEEVNDDVYPETMTIEVVAPLKMSVRLEDGTILANGDTFVIDTGDSVRFQMCTNNWESDVYSDFDVGVVGTKVYTFTAVPTKEAYLRVDNNSYFMAVRFYFPGAQYGKMTGIDNVTNNPIESLSINLPLGSTITANAFINSVFEKTGDVFVETAEDKTISYTDYNW